MAGFRGYPSIVDCLFATDVTVVLVGEDYNCGPEDAYRMAWMGELYGAKEFPYDPRCPVLKDLHEEEDGGVREALRGLEQEV